MVSEERSRRHSKLVEKLMKWFAELLIGSAMGPIVDVVKSFNEKKISENEMKVQIVNIFMGAFATLWKEQGKVLTAEINSQDWLVRRWRPIVALTSFFSVFYVIMIVPHLVHFGIMSESPGFGEVGLGWLFTITSVCIGGYMTARSAEKIATMVIGKKL